uniref:uncharacterized protein LOC128929618 n=1 Tax=Callithrix jacchus TaxID=9483 RepID=UPI0023DD5A3D|nr:uncharacterized protein LOC128929618 [Callithrix jacchus]
MQPARSFGQVEANRQEELAVAGKGRTPTSPAGARDGEEGAVCFGRHQRRSRTRRRREHSPSRESAGPQSRLRPCSPRLRGGQVLPARVRVWLVGRARSLHPLSRAQLGEEATALTWLLRGGRDGHGSGARGGTGSQGKDRLFRRGTGESGRPAARSPVSAAAPWAPTQSFSAAAGPPSHYPPPSSAAAAASTSSAETPRPLHTLSHHAAGETAAANTSLPGAGG